jgi:hypothetical protein
MRTAHFFAPRYSLAELCSSQLQGADLNMLNYVAPLAEKHGFDFYFAIVSGHAPLSTIPLSQFLAVGRNGIPVVIDDFHIDHAQHLVIGVSVYVVAELVIDMELQLKQEPGAHSGMGLSGLRMMSVTKTNPLHYALSCSLTGPPVLSSGSGNPFTILYELCATMSKC